jgi:hypothetical protein
MNYISTSTLKKTSASFPRRRESSQSTSPQRGRNIVASLREKYFYSWIPACAGMTESGVPHA